MPVGMAIALSVHEIGPLFTLLMWIGIAIVMMEKHPSWVEWMPVAAGLVSLQLLLDLHTRHLGDIVVAALHVPLLVFALLRRR